MRLRASLHWTEEDRLQEVFEEWRCLHNRINTSAEYCVRQVTGEFFCDTSTECWAPLSWKSQMYFIGLWSTTIYHHGSSWNIMERHGSSWICGTEGNHGCLISKWEMDEVRSSVMMRAITYFQKWLFCNLLHGNCEKMHNKGFSRSF